ncbi:MAG: hypothetical protein COZ46_03555 [Verrucomicrobia bacterium CG_4_10_14_3_um_filter_43_23]|nr:MAG: hypothetical protein AUJ82_02700 [Verrucomicrobia bacterium CG1_02_43_26]PIP59170.1 MAG: hypothetical protein COX01_05105 [Verrucomicrobia bacterium CG22_combo_CG10-13_8_21_14_all_43_17]PIX58446.1 MAG: hypothetical protein COZ46_03555 [Verrucomicrobia bacterium CG_4_10_14_3_um_filter_43_23]PIY63169.1 MAG: hypothetical protein COY94_00020 [Verrucomicrobia bacterium CG_4_10_14_0_8_um_filter_43_34]PJA44888.1 MAG: hypothetical protein CO175_00500 [Verrucomicrobia bacterium CG_4_9_14_3_um_fi
MDDSPMLQIFFAFLIILTWTIFNILIIVLRKSLLLTIYNTIDDEELQRISLSPKLNRLIHNVDHLILSLKILLSLSLTCLGGYLFFFYTKQLASIQDVFLLFVLSSLLISLVLYLVTEFSLSKWIYKHNESILTEFSLPLIVVGKLFAPSRALVKKFQRNINKESNYRNLIAKKLRLAYLAEEFKGKKGIFSKQTKRIALNALRIRGLDVSDVLLPRNQIQYLDLEDDIGENIKVAKESGHTRFPLCNGDLDHCIGIIHIKDLFHYDQKYESLDLREIQRKLLRVPEKTPVEQALERMLHLKIHMAIVIDEFGGTVGLITLERILEEIVGAIHDEFDTEEEMHIKPLARNRYQVAGLTTIHEIEHFLGISIDNNAVSTFSGLITTELGRIPEKNEKLHLHGMEITIDTVDDKRVIYGTVSLEKRHKPY